MGYSLSLFLSLYLFKFWQISYQQRYQGSLSALKSSMSLYVACVSVGKDAAGINNNISQYTAVKVLKLASFTLKTWWLNDLNRNHGQQRMKHSGHGRRLHGHKRQLIQDQNTFSSSDKRKFTLRKSHTCTWLIPLMSKPRTLIYFSVFNWRKKMK